MWTSMLSGKRPPSTNPSLQLPEGHMSWPPDGVPSSFPRELQRARKRRQRSTSL